ncbi:hypothetical protein ACFYM2_01420 [Streptomyces sp. NPDC006711]|uniref:hypothetical protein n=1 Tax=Streptomyces sp. NPDC006711 TaxID=3364762 RepID=UPI003699BD25
MSPSRITAPAVLAVLALALVTGCGGGSGGGRTEGAAEPGPVPSVSFTAPRQAAAPAAYQKLARGEVRLEQGPFSDRVKVTGAAIGARSAVTGHLAVTSDVSELIALELRAAYYDADGKLLGTGSYHYAEEGHEGQEGRQGQGAHGAGQVPPAEGAGIDFEIVPASLGATPAGAVLSLPVLVNE